MNIFHCCTHKTASQWVRAIFSDSRVQEFSGLQPYFYEDKSLLKYGVQKPTGVTQLRKRGSWSKTKGSWSKTKE